MALLKKLSPKTVVGDVKKLMTTVKNGETLKLYSVIGRVNGVQTGSTAFGDWTVFIGQFETTNYADGEISTATKCFLPEPVQTMLTSSLRDNDSVEFALEICAKKDDTLPTTYEYIVNPLVKIKESDELQSLRSIALARQSELGVKTHQAVAQLEELPQPDDAATQEVITPPKAKK